MSYILPDLRPLVFTARFQGGLAGIMPLWLDMRRKEAGFPDDLSDHLDIIVSDEDPDVAACLLLFAVSHPQSYDQLSLKHIRPDSNCVTAARALGLCDEVDEIFAPGKALPYAVLDLTRGYQEYLKSLGRKFRHNLNRMLRLAKSDGITVSELTPDYLDPKRLPDVFLSLHEARFGQETSLKRICKSPEVWIQHLFPALFAERRLRVFALMTNDRILGIDLAMVARSGLYAWNGGFLAEVEQYDPGKLLIHKAIEQCCQDGLTEYDLGWLGQIYKEHWRPVIRPIGDLQISVSTSAGRGSDIMAPVVDASP